MRGALAVGILAATLTAGDMIGLAASGIAPAATRVCGQMPGPHASYLSRVSGIKSAGTTWTVIATGVPCSIALAKTPGLLRKWAAAKLGASLALTGNTCLKMIDTGYSGTGTGSGGFLCHRGAGRPTTVFGPRTFTARETSPYTIAQIKAFFGIR